MLNLNAHHESLQIHYSSNNINRRTRKILRQRNRAHLCAEDFCVQYGRAVLVVISKCSEYTKYKISAHLSRIPSFVGHIRLTSSYKKLTALTTIIQILRKLLEKHSMLQLSKICRYMATYSMLSTLYHKIHKSHICTLS